jgi:hypothetical protein
MRQISARLSDESYAQLKALTVILQTSQADVIARALQTFEHSLGDNEQRLLRLLRTRHRS